MKSKQMAEDELNRAITESDRELREVWVNRDNYNRAAAESIGRMRKTHKERQAKANKSIHAQEDKEAVSLFGWGCFAAVIVLILLVWALRISASCCQ